MTLYDSLEVYVELAGESVLAGHAQVHRSRGNLTSTTFQYEPAYLAHTTACQLDPALQLVVGTQQTQGLPGAFADSASDRWGRNLIKKRERALARQETRRPRGFDDADFLAGVGDIADSLAEVSVQAKEDARQLFRRVAVSVGLNNTDDHLRNHGFLRGRGGWALSPAFDVNPPVTKSAE